MSEEEILAMTSEMADLDIALIFLNDGKQRTINLKNDNTKHGFPDLDYRIGRIESSINRFQPRLNEIREAFKANKEAKEKAV